MGITLRQILSLNYLGDAIILGGHNGLDREIRYVNVMEVPDIFDWVSPDELILTTGYPFKDTPKEMAALITKLNEKGVAGIAIKPSRFLKELPVEIVQLADEIGFPLITLAHNAQFDKIILEILTKIINEDYYIIKKAQEVRVTLSNLVQEGADFPGISQVLSDLCFGEIILKDAFGHILAQSKPSQARLLIDAPSVDTCNIIEKKVQVSKQIIAYITLKSWRTEIENADIVALDFTATIIAAKMFKIEKYKEKEKRYRNEFLNTLIFNPMLSAEQVIQNGKSLGLDLSLNFTAMIIDTNPLFKDFERKNENYIIDNMPSLIHNTTLLDRDKYVYWNNSDGIVILCPLKNNNNSYLEKLMSAAREIKANINSLVPDSVITVGIGRYCSDILNIGKSYHEAHMAIRIGGQVWGNDGIYHYNDLGVYQLLSQFTNKEQSDEFITNTLGCLIEYDNKKNSQLILTLEQLLTGENIKDIAERLYIHPKTISFRKHRIEEILGFSLENPEKRLSLSLALKLYKLSNAIKKG